MISKAIKIIFVLFTFLNYSQNTELFDQGNDFYNQGKYFEAIEKYNLILKNGSHSEELYYNLGNSYYKLNDIANSIFYFEKALVLTPTNEKVLNNLSFANNMLIDKIEPLPTNQISSFFNSLVGLFFYSTWQYIYLFFEFLAIIFLVFYIVSKNPTIKKRYFITALSFSLFFLLSMLAANISKGNYQQDNPAIIFDKEVDLRAEPNLRSEEINILHEGTKLNIIESINDWSLVELKNGNKGWLTTSSFRLIK